MSTSGEPHQHEGPRLVQAMTDSSVPLQQQHSKEHLAVDQLKMMYSMLQTPLEINVACENVECGSLLKVMVPESVSRLAPPNLVIRCAGCKKLLSVSLPEETYIQHQIQRLENIRQRQQQMERMQMLTQEIQQKKTDIEQQMNALISQGTETPKIPGGLQEDDSGVNRKISPGVSGKQALSTPDIGQDHVERRDT